MRGDPGMLYILMGIRSGHRESGNGTRTGDSDHCSYTLVACWAWKWAWKGDQPAGDNGPAGDVCSV